MIPTDLIFNVSNDQSHVEVVRVPSLRVERVRQLVLRLPGQDVVAVELAALRLDVEWLHPQDPEVVALFVGQDVVVQLQQNQKNVTMRKSTP